MKHLAKWGQHSRSCFWSVLLFTGIGVSWCTGDSVEPVMPQPAQIFGWGRQAPSVRLEARAVSSQPAQRVFVSAIILDAQGKTIDRVPLYDDGTHGDSQAGDLSFTELYTPRTEGIFQVRFKAEWERNNQRVARFSEARPFEVVRAPYARFRNKLTSERPAVGATVDSPVVLLVGNDEHYKGSLESITIRATSAPTGSAEIPRRLTHQPIIRYRFESPGEYHLTVQAVMTYKGQHIATEPDQFAVVYNSPSVWWCGAGVVLLLLGLFLPGKREPVYEHKFVLRNPVNGTQQTVYLSSQDTEISLEDEALTVKYLRGSKGVELLVSNRTDASGNETLYAGEQYRTPSGQILDFVDTSELEKKPVANRLIPNTLIKIIFVVVGAILIAYYLFLQHQLSQLTNL
ncbi:MAG: hypothetical protein KatS3mg019_0935 [Fimbriimonadales bacterium]|nr:MAG: hypothetical protein KatS3mg019_0935 [Fimbriimonadales bacterium]